MSSKRLAYLEKLTAEDKADSFAWYALALEYVGLEKTDDALRTFESLRTRDVDYVPMYLMCGAFLAKSGRGDEARGWLEQGITVASKKGDSKAEGELREELGKLG